MHEKVTVAARIYRTTVQQEKTTCKVKRFRKSDSLTNDGSTTETKTES